MDELVRWLGEQLDEDERIARRAADLCGCHPPAPSWSFRDGDEPTDGRILVVDEPHPTLKRKIGRRWNGSYEGLFMAEHIVRHDPARVLREVEAKRRVITGLQHLFRGDDPFVSSIADDSLRSLAEPYADRPGYRDEWRP